MRLKLPARAHCVAEARTFSQNLPALIGGNTIEGPDEQIKIETRGRAKKAFKGNIKSARGRGQRNEVPGITT